MIYTAQQANQNQSLIAAFDRDGFLKVAGVLSERECHDVASALEAGNSHDAASRRLLDQLWCQQLATDLKSHSVLAALLPTSAVAVQCTFFDKSADKNWLVALHQDLSIPVRERVPSEECTGWSAKEGVLYVQPPNDVLESLIAIRVHLDDCLQGNGPLRVIAGSHRHGRLKSTDAEALRLQLGETECFSRRGDALVMRPLLLHASSKAQKPSRRRVLHFLFGPRDLGHGLNWHRAIDLP